MNLGSAAGTSQGQVRQFSGRSLAVSAIPCAEICSSCRCRVQTHVEVCGRASKQCVLLRVGRLELRISHPKRARIGDDLVFCPPPDDESDTRRWGCLREIGRGSCVCIGKGLSWNGWHWLQ